MDKANVGVLNRQWQTSQRNSKEHDIIGEQISCFSGLLLCSQDALLKYYLTVSRVTLQMTARFMRFICSFFPTLQNFLKDKILKNKKQLTLVNLYILFSGTYILFH